MIRKIFAYGQPVLKKTAVVIDKDFVGLEIVIHDMWETMANAKGVGLAAPQIGLSIRIFIIDSSPMFEDEEVDERIKRVFINPQKVEETGDLWKYEEGCLSIPDIAGDVSRPETIRLKYLDENFVEHEEEFDGMNARVIQHEYDHLEGILFTEKLTPIKKRRIRKKLNLIKEGNIDTRYKMKFV